MKILIVDDDPLICKSLSLTLQKEQGFHVAGTAADGRQAIDICGRDLPDLVLMDIRMPEMDGIQTARLLKKQYPQLRIVMLTTFQDKPSIEMALKAGAEGYLLKTERIGSIVEKLRALQCGVAVMDCKVLKTLTSPQVHSLEVLTPREKDVLGLVTQGLSNREIAGQLFLSEGTVRNILSVIMDKLQVKNRTQLSLAVMGYWKGRKN